MVLHPASYFPHTPDGIFRCCLLCCPSAWHAPASAVSSFSFCDTECHLGSMVSRMQHTLASLLLSQSLQILIRKFPPMFDQLPIAFFLPWNLITHLLHMWGRECWISVSLTCKHFDWMSSLRGPPSGHSHRLLLCPIGWFNTQFGKQSSFAKSEESGCRWLIERVWYLSLRWWLVFPCWVCPFLLISFSPQLGQLRGGFRLAAISKLLDNRDNCRADFPLVRPNKKSSGSCPRNTQLGTVRGKKEYPYPKQELVERKQGIQYLVLPPFWWTTSVQISGSLEMRDSKYDVDRPRHSRVTFFFNAVSDFGGFG